jgi:hypothetical protein
METEFDRLAKDKKGELDPKAATPLAGIILSPALRLAA